MALEGMTKLFFASEIFSVLSLVTVEAPFHVRTSNAESVLHLLAFLVGLFYPSRTINVSKMVAIDGFAAPDDLGRVHSIFCSHLRLVE